MLTVSNITFRYPRNRKNTLEDFSLTLQSGNIYGLLGKNGAGKSTLLYLMCGLLTPPKGSATLDGTPVDTVVALFIPGGAAPEESRTLLSPIAVELLDADFRARLKAAETPMEVARVVASCL